MTKNHPLGLRATGAWKGSQRVPTAMDPRRRPRIIPPGQRLSARLRPIVADLAVRGCQLQGPAVVNRGNERLAALAGVGLNPRLNASASGSPGGLSGSVCARGGARARSDEKMLNLPGCADLGFARRTFFSRERGRAAGLRVTPWRSSRCRMGAAGRTRCRAGWPARWSRRPAGRRGGAPCRYRRRRPPR